MQPYNTTLSVGAFKTAMDKLNQLEIIDSLRDNVFQTKSLF